jgi:hypothetical protein
MIRLILSLLLASATAVTATTAMARIGTRAARPTWISAGLADLETFVEVPFGWRYVAFLA